MTKLSDVLKKNKIDSRRVLIASRKLETLQREDRQIRLAKRVAKTDAEKKDTPEAKQKPRSGRPISPPTLNAMLAGKSVSGPAKTRVLRAVNAVLKQKGKGEVALKDLF